MRTKLTAVKLSAIAAIGLIASAVHSHAQSVNLSATISDVPLGGGVFAYTLTLQNTGPEDIESLWAGWIVNSFNINNPTALGNSLGWSSSAVGASIQYGGTPSTVLHAGSTGTFTFDSTSTPAQFMSGAAGSSVAYGVNAQQFGIFDTTQDSREFNPTVVPEPSTLGLIAVGAFGVFGAARRKVMS